MKRETIRQHIFALPLSGYALKFLWYLLDHGTCALSISDIRKLVHLTTRAGTTKMLAKLQKQNIIKQLTVGKSAKVKSTYAINEDFTSWELVSVDILLSTSILADTSAAETGIPQDTTSAQTSIPGDSSLSPTGIPVDTSHQQEENTGKPLVETVFDDSPEGEGNHQGGTIGGIKDGRGRSVGLVRKERKEKKKETAEPSFPLKKITPDQENMVEELMACLKKANGGFLHGVERNRQDCLKLLLQVQSNPQVKNPVAFLSKVITAGKKLKFYGAKLTSFYKLNHYFLEVTHGLEESGGLYRCESGTWHLSKKECSCVPANVTMSSRMIAAFPKLAQLTPTAKAYSERVKRLYPFQPLVPAT